MQQPKSIVVIGAGGIGYHLIEPLARYVNYSNPECQITIIDGDTIEDGNLSRQHEANFVGRNKAEALEAIVNNRIMPKKPVQSLPYFFTPTSRQESAAVEKLLSDGVHVFLCVDNNATRVYVETLAADLKDVVVISGGNDLLKGQVQLYVRQDRKNLTPRPSEVNPEILDMDDEFPDEIGCDELVVSEPQLIFTNNMVACMMLSLWYSILQSDAPSVNEVCTDIIRASASPFVRKSLKPVLSK